MINELGLNPANVNSGQKIGDNFEMLVTAWKSNLFHQIYVAKITSIEIKLAMKNFKTTIGLKFGLKLSPEKFKFQG